MSDVTDMTDYVPQTGQTMKGRPGHEGNILAIRGLVIFTVSLIIVTVVVDYGMALVMELFKRDEAVTRGLAPHHFVDDLKPFPAPRIQADPTEDLVEYKKAQQRLSDTLYWSDKKAGLVHVPIDQAIDMLVKHPAPPVPNTVNPVTGLPLPKAEVKP